MTTVADVAARRQPQGRTAPDPQRVLIGLSGAATQHNPVLKALYDRWCPVERKRKGGVIACMRKMLSILNISD